MAGFNFLTSPAEWTQHCTTVSREQAIAGLQVAWGNGPREYPCMVATAVVRTTEGVKPMSVYIYPADAAKLLTGAGWTCLPPGAQANIVPQSPNPMMPQGAPEFSAQQVRQLVSRYQEEQRRFNAVIAAQNVAIIHFLRETGICTDEAFEQKYNEALSMVDSMVAERRDQAIQKLKEEERGEEAKLLDRLYPPPEAA